MKCSFCSEQSLSKCINDSLFLCQKHLDTHCAEFHSYSYEKLEHELKRLRLNKIKSKVLKRIEKVQELDTYLVLELAKLIHFIKSTANETRKKLASYSRKYLELLNRTNFCQSELILIEKLESEKIVLSNPSFDEIQSSIDKLLSADLIRLKTPDDLVKVSKNWYCECGVLNMPSFEICQACNKLREGVVGWVCSFCATINKNLNLYVCETCSKSDLARIPVVEEVKFETWQCECGSSNMIDLAICDKCKMLKKGLSGWICSFCSTWNEKDDSSVCIACCKSDPLKLPEQEEVKIEIWECECKSSNLIEYSICQNCSKIKPGTLGWVCKKCSNLNTLENTKCSVCDDEKCTLSG